MNKLDKNKKIIIVGAGCAGLTTAHKLMKEGYTNFEILERNPVGGGRMLTYKENGYSCDLAAQVVHPGYKYAKNLIHELGMDDQLCTVKLSQMLIDDGEKLIPTIPTGTPELDKYNAEWMAKMGPENFMRLAADIKALCDNEKYHEGSVEWGIHLDNKGNFRDYIVDNYGEGVLKGFVEPVLSAIGLVHPENTGVIFGSMIMWTMLAGAADVLANGVGSLAEAIIKKCGDKVKTGVEVQEIVIKDGKAVGVKTKSGFMPADAVVCAASANKALKILPNAPESIRSALSKVTYCPTITTLLFLDRDKARFPYDATGALLMRSNGNPMGAISLSSSKTERCVPPGKECILMCLYEEGARKLWNASDEEVLNEVMRYMGRIMPETVNAIEGIHTARFAEGNYIMEPGCATAIKYMRENHYKDVEGLYLCGEYMYTGSYESAIAAGGRTAQVIMGQLEHI